MSQLHSESLSEKLLRFVRHIEAIEEDKSAVAIALRETYALAKIEELDVNALKQVVKLRKLSNEVRDEREITLHAYMEALGLSRPRRPAPVGKAE